MGNTDGFLADHKPKNSSPQKGLDLYIGTIILTHAQTMLIEHFPSPCSRRWR